MRTWVLLLAIIGATVALPRSAVGQQIAGSTDRGRDLATTWCGGCHLVDQNQRVARDAVPTFRSIAAMKSTTSLSLHVFLQTPHTRMPDWRLTNQEIDDVVAYILSMRPDSS